ncbi:MAG: hypothetical protein JNK49_21715 [Planctomycetes bacterium]|nr:hypothetical protein [Planctomycetota bacterium]
MRTNLLCRFGRWLGACGWLVTAGLGALPAQEQATTLWAGCQQAAVVARATVVSVDDQHPEWLRIEFRSEEVLRGALPAGFALLEPASACCGRALLGLVPGTTHLLFLQRTGAALHPFGGSRFVLEDSPELLAHVRALLAVTTPASLATVLAAGLSAEEPRIAADAAHTLATRPELPLSSRHLQAAHAAFASAHAAGSAMAPSLLEVLLPRLDTVALDELLSRYLEEPREDRARLLRAGLRRLPPETLLARLSGQLRVDEQPGLRCAELCAELPAYEGTAGLRSLLQRNRHPRVQLAAAEALLAFGTAPASLRYDLPAPVLALAQRRRAAPPHLRNLVVDRR